MYSYSNFHFPSVHSSLFLVFFLLFSLFLFFFVFFSLFREKISFRFLRQQVSKVKQSTIIYRPMDRRTDGQSIPIEIKFMDREKIIQNRRNSKKQGRIHGHQLRTGGQGRKCVFSHFSTRSPPTNQPTDQRTDKASYRVACPQLKRWWENRSKSS